MTLRNLPFVRHMNQAEARENRTTTRCGNAARTWITARPRYFVRVSIERVPYPGISLEHLTIDIYPYFYKCTLLGGPLNRFNDKPFCLVGIQPVTDLHPFARLEIFVMFEKMFDLLQRDFRQVRGV